MNKLTVSQRMYLLSSILISIMMVIGYIGYSATDDINDGYNRLVDHTLAKRRLTIRMTATIGSLRLPTTMALLDTDKSKMKGHMESLQKVIDDYETILSDYNKFKVDPGEEKLTDRLNKAWTKYKKTLATFEEIALRNGAGSDELKNFFEKVLPESRNEFTEAATAITDFQTAASDKDSAELDVLNDNINKLIISFMFGALVIALMLSVYISRTTNNALNAIVKSILQTSDEVSSTSQALTASGQQLAVSSQEQASSVEEISSSLEEITGMVASSIKNTKNAVNLSEKITTLVSEGSASMSELNEAVTKIAESNHRVEKLARLIEEIGEKTELIDEIVFQTRLLSFNASVEAERAGEHGRGFAVVAQEVGSLALMSGKSAAEISNIVKNSIKEAREVVSENRERVESGVSSCKQTSQKLSDIESASREISAGVSEVMRASEEQGAGVKQINDSIQLISQTVQENASSAEECAGSSRSLSDQSTNLVEVVGSLELVVSGKVSLQKKPSHSDGGASRANIVNIATKQKKSPAPTAKPQPALKKAVGTNLNEDAWDKL